MNSRNQQAADDVIRQRSDRVFRVFNVYIRRMLSKRFDAVRLLHGPPASFPADRSVICYFNHPSWYDPLIMVMVADIYLPDHVSYGPMDAEALEKYGFMKKLGIFGVAQDSARGAARFLQVARGLLAMPGKALLITPQGEFTDVRSRPVRFKPGLARVASDCGSIVQPVAMEFAYWEESRPEILLHFGRRIDTREERLEPDAWQARLEEELSRTQDELASAAMARDPEPFVTIIDGKRGANPVYDRWRFLKALIRGEKFSAAHTDIKKD